MVENDGGPAFPANPTKMVEVDDQGRVRPWGYSGMSLRDWFAGQALAGTLAHKESGTHYDAIAEEAYSIADAMLVARTEKDS